jgi:hypothetical protein
MLYFLASTFLKKKLLSFIKLKKRINAKKKKYAKIFLKKNLKNIYKTYSFILLPIKIKLYYNKNLLKCNFIKFNIALEYYLHNIFNNNYNTEKKNYNILEKTKKLNIDKYIHSKFNYYINLFV